MLRQTSGGGAALEWVTPLEASYRFWEDWFTGMSREFLRATCPRVLILAGTDRLDRELTIAQMQGKLQLIVSHESGHALQEDVPHTVREAILLFVKRFRVGQPLPTALQRLPGGVAPSPPRGTDQPDR